MSDQDKSQKTEEPTSKRLSEAHEKGQVAKSQEVSNWFVLSAAALVVSIFAESFARRLMTSVTPLLVSPHEISIDAEMLVQLLAHLGETVGLMLLPPMVLLAAAAIAGHVIQHRPMMALAKLKPTLSKISPAKGLKRMFSMQSVINLLKASVKIVLLGGVAIFVVWPDLQALPTMMTMPLDIVASRIMEIALLLSIGVVGALTALAMLDMIYQKWDFHQNQKMSRQEIKDETKQAEGDPQVKARIRQVRMERARRRMMAAVPTADVIITNPTHYAVALSYVDEEMAAPRLVAKGRDLVARRIREIAQEHDVPIVENPPLARALEADVEIDQEIPPHFYKAVAEVIGYVMGLRRRRRAGVASR